MIAVRTGLLVAAAGLVALLGVLVVAAGTGPPGVAAGLVCGAVLGTAAARCARRAGAASWGPADVVTLVRATLACAVAALVVDALLSVPSVPLFVPLAAVALALDAVDGPVARSTGTVSPLGARIDGEADAFLMLVLSVYVAMTLGAWLLAIGVVRYAFALAGLVWPWLRADLPPRYWRKVVTAVSGIALVVGAAGVAPPAATYGVLGLAVLLLAESFGRDVGWLWRQREAHAVAAVAPAAGLAAP